MHLFSLASVNMRRRNAIMHALLNTNSDDDILFVQEPWYGCIGNTQSDDQKDGKEVWRGAGHPSWNLFYPHVQNGQRAKVMTYVRIHDRHRVFKKNYLRGTVRLDLCSHPCILITDISLNGTLWHTINFYNDVDNPTALHTLLTLDLDPTVHMLLVGDFNTHSPSWSPKDWTEHPASARRVEDWTVAQDLLLLSPPGIPTHRGENGARDSTIDLVWCNSIAWTSGTFTSPSILWGNSLRSDHTLLRIPATIPSKLSRLPEDHVQGFTTDISDAKWEEWSCILDSLVYPCPMLSHHSQIDEQIDLLYVAINSACKEVMRKKGAVPGFNAKWWNDDCRALAKQLREAESDDTKSALAAELKRLIST